MGRASSQKQQEEASRRGAPAERLGPRNKGLPVSPFLERFLDSSVVERDIYFAIALAVPRSSRKSSSRNSKFWSRAALHIRCLAVTQHHAANLSPCGGSRQLGKFDQSDENY